MLSRYLITHEIYEKEKSFKIVEKTVWCVKALTMTWLREDGDYKSLLYTNLPYIFVGDCFAEENKINYATSRKWIQKIEEGYWCRCGVEP